MRAQLAVLMGSLVLASGCRAAIRDDWFACTETEECPPGQVCDEAAGFCRVAAGDAGLPTDAPGLDAPGLDVPGLDAPDGSTMAAHVFLVHALPEALEATLQVDDTAFGEPVGYGETTATFDVPSGKRSLDVVGLDAREASAILEPGSTHAAILRVGPLGPEVSWLPVPETGVVVFSNMTTDAFITTDDGTAALGPGPTATVEMDELPDRVSVGPVGALAVAVFDGMQWRSAGARVVVMLGELTHPPQSPTAVRAIVAVPSLPRVFPSLPLHWLVAPMGTPMAVCRPGGASFITLSANETVGPITDLPPMVELADTTCAGTRTAILSVGNGPRNLLTMHGNRGLAVAEPSTVPTGARRYVVLNAGGGIISLGGLGGIGDIGPGVTESEDLAVGVDTTSVMHPGGPSPVTLPAAPFTFVVLEGDTAPIAFAVLPLTPGGAPSAQRQRF